MAKRHQSQRQPIGRAAGPRIFLSASVPLPSRDAVYFDTADVVAIRDAVRALTIVVMEENAQLVFGGHPAILPMIRLQVAQTGMPVGDRVVMFWSRYFERVFPDDHTAFERVVLTDSVDGDRGKSLLFMRQQMLAGPFRCGIFIGGMNGVEDEYAMFRQMHPKTPAFPIASTGAAAGIIYEADQQLRKRYPELSEEISYLTLMRSLTAPQRRRKKS